MNHQPLSASFVLGRAGLNSAELSRNGRGCHFHTAGLVNWASWARGPVHRGVATGHTARGSGPPSAVCPIGQVSPSPRSLPSSVRSPVVSAVVLRKNSGSRPASGNPCSPAQKRKPLHTCRPPCPRPQPRLHLPRHRATPCQPELLCGRRGGSRGGARSCRRPPGPVRTRERMFLPPPARPARAGCPTLAWQSLGLERIGGML